VKVTAHQRAAVGSLPRHDRRGRGPRRNVMADLAYALVLIGGFALLVLAMRGLQRL
jgi:hypothetical protein